jgi:endonuclease YncB( thermonuclease family)
LTIPLNGDRFDDVITLGRVLGRVSVDGRDLSEQQVKAGHAKESK